MFSKPYFQLFNLNSIMMTHRFYLISLLFTLNKIIRLGCLLVLLAIKVLKTKIRFLKNISFSTMVKFIIWLNIYNNFLIIFNAYALRSAKKSLRGAQRRSNLSTFAEMRLLRFARNDLVNINSFNIFNHLKLTLLWLIKGTKHFIV